MEKSFVAIEPAQCALRLMGKTEKIVHTLGVNSFHFASNGHHFVLPGCMQISRWRWQILDWIEIWDMETTTLQKKKKMMPQSHCQLDGWALSAPGNSHCRVMWYYMGLLSETVQQHFGSLKDNTLCSISTLRKGGVATVSHTWGIGQNSAPACSFLRHCLLTNWWRWARTAMLKQKRLYSPESSKCEGLVTSPTSVSLTAVLNFRRSEIDKYIFHNSAMPNMQLGAQSHKTLKVFCHEYVEHVVVQLFTAVAVKDCVCTVCDQHQGINPWAALTGELLPVLTCLVLPTYWVVTNYQNGGSKPAFLLSTPKWGWRVSHIETFNLGPNGLCSTQGGCVSLGVPQEHTVGLGNPSQ